MLLLARWCVLIVVCCLLFSIWSCVWCCFRPRLRVCLRVVTVVVVHGVVLLVVGGRVADVGIVVLCVGCGPLDDRLFVFGWWCVVLL